MKYTIIKTCIGLMGCLILANACKKNEATLLKTNLDVDGKANVKVGYFSPVSSLTNRGVQVKVDEARVTSLLTYAVAFPGGGLNMGGLSNADYLLVDAGSRNVKVSIPAVNTNTDSVMLFSGSLNMLANRKQTILLTDTLPNVAATVVYDDVADPPSGFSRAKFFNGIPGTTVDLYVRTPLGVVNAAKDIPYKGVSTFFDISGSIGADTFQIVRSGNAYTPANVVSSYSNTILAGRTYTVLSRGYINVVSTTDIRRPLVSLIVNK
jgi:Domain of unknown function (DUF4397)